VATSPHETKAALLEAVAARARDTAEDAEAADVERFVRSYYANVAPEAGERDDPVAQRIDAWASRKEDAVERCLQVLGDIKAGGVDDLARLSVAVREIRNLTQSSGTAAPVVEAAELRR
jgi:NAD-specific glutamate dehydrogenase